MQMSDSDKANEEKLLRGVALLCASLVIGGAQAAAPSKPDSRAIESDAVSMARRFKIWIEEGR